MKVAINGAGIAGTALAYWLSQMGPRRCLGRDGHDRGREGGAIVQASISTVIRDLK